MTKAVAARKGEHKIRSEVQGTEQPLRILESPAGIDPLFYTATPYGGTMVLSQLFSADDMVQLLPEGKIIFEQGFDEAEADFLLELQNFLPDLHATSKVQLPPDLDISDILEP